MGFDSVDELNSLDDVVEELGAVEQPPSFGRGLHQLVDHREAGQATPVALGPSMPPSHRSERALDGIGRPQVLPVFGREVVERQ